jgi:hypothetical protein
MDVCLINIARRVYYCLNAKLKMLRMNRNLSKKIADEKISLIFFTSEKMARTATGSTAEIRLAKSSI